MTCDNDKHSTRARVLCCTVSTNVFCMSVLRVERMRSGGPVYLDTGHPQDTAAACLIAVEASSYGDTAALLSTYSWSSPAEQSRSPGRRVPGCRLPTVAHTPAAEWQGFSFQNLIQ